MTRKLERSLTEQKQQTEQVIQKIPGLLGIPIDGQRRVEVPNRNAFVYVRLRSSQNEVIQAYNNQVAPSYNLPVLVERRRGRYEVIGVDTARYENNWTSFSPFLPRHGNTHSFDIETGGGGDIVWVYGRQFMPSLVLPSGSAGGPNVIMAPYTLKKIDGAWNYVGNTGTANITTHNPSSPTGAVMALVYLDAPSGNPYFVVNSGTVFNNLLTGSSQIYPYIPQITSPQTQIPLAAIRLITGTSRLSWDNIYDVRQYFHIEPSGSAGSGGTGTFTGDASSVVLTDGSGNLATYPWLKWGTSSEEFVEFGADDPGKEVNAGKIGYKTFDDDFDIVGAGTGSTERRVKIYDILETSELGIFPNLRLPNLNLVTLGTDIDGNVVSASMTGASASISVEDEGVPLGGATTFNFVGPNVDASISGSVARVFVTGSAGGGAPAGLHEQLQYNNSGSFGGALLWYNTVFNVGLNKYSIRLTASGSNPSNGNDVYLLGGPGLGAGAGGGAGILGGDAPGSGTAGGVNIDGGDSVGGAGGGVIIVGGRGSKGGGIVELRGGEGASGSADGYVAITTPDDVYQLRFRTRDITSTRDYFLPDASGTFLLDAPTDGTTYGRRNATWVPVLTGSSSGPGGTAPNTIAVQEEGAFVASGSALNFVGPGITASVSGSVVQIHNGPAHEQTITTPTGTINVYPVANIPQGGKTLRLRIVARTTRVSTFDGVKIRFNGDTGNNYSAYTMWHFSPNSQNNQSQDAGGPVEVAFANAGTSPHGTFGAYDLTIYRYSQPWGAKEFQVRGGQRTTSGTTNMFIYDTYGEYVSNSAITRIELLPTNGPNFASGTYAAIWIE